MSVDDPALVKEQYRDPTNLNARGSLHARFSTNGYPWFGFVADRIVAGSHDRVLEAGGGPGGLWSERSRLDASARVVFSDLSRGMVATARSRIADDRFVYLVSDAQALPYRDGSFDVVVANHMLYHVPDVPKAIAEFARVLEPNGRLIAATNGSRHMLELRPLVGKDPVRISGFDLDGGASLLAPHFTDISRDNYSDELVVTEAEPLLDYIRSMTGLFIGSASEDEIRDEIDATIEREGAFRIEKDVGVFTAVRK